jgi:hypothetical protein
MFTLEDVKNNTFDSCKSYTKDTNPVSYKLSQMDRRNRADTMEKLVTLHLNNIGIQAEHKGYGPYENDINMYVNGRTIKGEVKTSLVSHTNNTYFFQGINPYKFDILFLVFITPSDIYTMWTHKSAAMDYWSGYCDMPGGGVNFRSQLWYQKEDQKWGYSATKDSIYNQPVARNINYKPRRDRFIKSLNMLEAEHSPNDSKSLLNFLS